MDTMRRRVQVTWNDIRSDAGWHDAEFEFVPRFCEAITVGFVVAEGPLSLSVAGSILVEGGFGDVTTIPAACITKIEEI